MEEQKVGHKQMGTLPYIIALDFDGTLVEDKFPEIGEPNVSLFERVIKWQNLGYKVILWTCRDNNTADRNLDRAVQYCFMKWGIVFDAVNQNIPEVIQLFNNDTRKVYANVYIDDKSLSPFFPTYMPGFDLKEEFRPWRLTR